MLFPLKLERSHNYPYLLLCNNEVFIYLKTKKAQTKACTGNLACGIDS